MPTQIAVFITEVCQHFASFPSECFKWFFFFYVKILTLLIKKLLPSSPRANI